MIELYQAIEGAFYGYPLMALFLSGFLSATLLPGSSEISLYTALQIEHLSLALVIAMATLGNTLGGMVNYYLGRYLPNKRSKEKDHPRVYDWLQRYGYWSLLLSWLPVIGDPLCLAAGWLRMNAILCFIIIGLGKFTRYLLLALIVKGFI